MLRKPFVVVFIRLRVKARHHEELPFVYCLDDSVEFKSFISITIRNNIFKEKKFIATGIYEVIEVIGLASFPN